MSIRGFGMIPKFRAWFPAPREVHRYLYKNNVNKNALTVNWFPAPREVDREIYFHCLKTFISGIQSLRPLAR